MKHLLILSFFVVGCANNTSKKNTDKTTPTELTKDSMPLLQDILDEKKARFEEKASEEKKRIYGEGIDAVRTSGILENAMNIGDKAPNFSLTNALGKTIALKEELEKGPVVLTWYRGGWCPYCNLTLKRLQDELPSFKKHKAQLIALTPEIPDSSLSTVDKNALQFEVLSDVGNKIGKEYGIVFTLTPEVAKAYQKGFGLHSFNGNESNELPLAATYIIKQDGTIHYAFLHPDYRNRAEPIEIIKALEKL